jgi:hypothetical protein
VPPAKLETRDLVAGGTNRGAPPLCVLLFIYILEISYCDLASCPCPSIRLGLIAELCEGLGTNTNRKKRLFLRGRCKL